MSRFGKFTRRVGKTARFVIENRRQLATNARLTAKESAVWGARQAQKGTQFVIERGLNVVAIAMEKLIFRGLWKPKETGTPPRPVEPGETYDATDDMDALWNSAGDGLDRPRRATMIPPRMNGRPHLHEVAGPPPPDDDSEE